MKKITTLFFLLIFIFLIIKSNQNNEETILVNYIVDSSYQKLYLKFEDNSLTTKNFKIYFNSNMKIISVYPSIDENNCLLIDNRYIFPFKNLNSNLNGYISYYDSLYANETSNYFYGTPISIVELDISGKELNKILSKNKDIKYSQELCGSYQ